MGISNFVKLGALEGRVPSKGGEFVVSTTKRGRPNDRHGLRFYSYFEGHSKGAMSSPLGNRHGGKLQLQDLFTLAKDTEGRTGCSE